MFRSYSGSSQNQPGRRSTTQKISMLAAKCRRFVGRIRHPPGRARIEPIFIETWASRAKLAWSLISTLVDMQFPGTTFEAWQNEVEDQAKAEDSAFGKRLRENFASFVQRVAEGKGGEGHRFTKEVDPITSDPIDKGDEGWHTDQLVARHQLAKWEGIWQNGEAIRNTALDDLTLQDLQTGK